MFIFSRKKFNFKNIALLLKLCNKNKKKETNVNFEFRLD